MPQSEGSRPSAHLRHVLPARAERSAGAPSACHAGVAAAPPRDGRASGPGPSRPPPNGGGRGRWGTSCRKACRRLLPRRRARAGSGGSCAGRCGGGSADQPWRSHACRCRRRTRPRHARCASRSGLAHTLRSRRPVRSTTSCLASATGPGDAREPHRRLTGGAPRARHRGSAERRRGASASAGQRGSLRSAHGDVVRAVAFGDPSLRPSRLAFRVPSRSDGWRRRGCRRGGKPVPYRRDRRRSRAGPCA